MNALKIMKWTLYSCIFLVTGCAYQQLNTAADAIEAAPLEGAYDVSVANRNDHFVLTGKVASERDRKVIAETVSAHAGSHKVRNDLVVDPRLKAQGAHLGNWKAFVEQPNKNWIEKVVRRHDSDLQWSIQEDRLLLEGQAKSHREVDQLLAELFMIPGVREIDSRIGVKNQNYMTYWNQNN